MAINIAPGPARQAGLLYLVVVLAGIISLAYVPSQLFVHGNAEQTVANIAASTGLFRLGIAAGFVCYLAFLLLPFASYRLLGHAHRGAAVLMVAFAVVSVPISLGNMVNKLDVLTLLDGASVLAGTTSPDVQAAVMRSLARYNNGILVAELFWGLWLLPLGYLVLKSRMLPSLLGVLLIAGCFGYLTDVFATVLFPSWSTSTAARFVTAPASFGEIGTCLWLLVFGVRESARRAD